MVWWLDPFLGGKRYVMYEVCHFDLVISVSPFEVFFRRNSSKKAKHMYTQVFLISLSIVLKKLVIKQWGSGE